MRAALNLTDSMFWTIQDVGGGVERNRRDASDARAGKQLASHGIGLICEQREGGILQNAYNSQTLLKQRYPEGWW